MNIDQTQESEGVADLQREVDALMKQKDLQIAEVISQLENTVDFLTKTIENILYSLGITVTGYSIFIGQRVVHEGVLVSVLIGKIIGESIESLVTIFKEATQIMEAADSGSIAAAAATGVAPGPLLHLHDILAAAAANSLEAITNLVGELYEQITGTGSAIESVNDIIGTAVDIAFDTSRIGYDFVSLGAQIKEHRTSLLEAKKYIDEAGLAATNAILDISSKYDQVIASRLKMIEYKKQFDLMVDKTE